MEKQISEECVLRTYRPAVLNFETSAEKEDVIKWTHLELLQQNLIKFNSTEINVECKNNSIQNNKEKSNLIAKSKALRIANFNLWEKIKSLKSRMQRMAQMCKCKDLNKKKIRRKKYYKI